MKIAIIDDQSKTDIINPDQKVFGKSTNAAGLQKLTGRYYGTF
ncbi:hypothetical protein [Flavimarina sp. Hel_I_48]|nr:hypothetical protein [Flavimarina sp. Hel_I_48]